MADSPLVAAVLFGFDRKTLYLRLEPADGRAAELAAARLELDVATSPRVTGTSRSRRRGDGALIRRRRARGASVHGRTLELALPLVIARRRSPTSAALTLRLFAGDAPLARYPADGGLADHRPRRRIRSRELVGVAALRRRALPRASASRTSAA